MRAWPSESAASTARRRLPWLLVLAMLCLMAGPARAEAEMPEAGACRQDWQIEVHELPLKSALEQLAEAMGFELRYLARSNPVRSGRFAGDGQSLLNRLAGGVSLIISGRDDPVCGGFRIVRVVVLPVGQDADPPPAEPVPEGLQRYRRAHGMDPLTGEPARSGADVN